MTRQLLREKKRTYPFAVVGQRETAAGREAELAVAVAAAVVAKAAAAAVVVVVAAAVVAVDDVVDVAAAVGDELETAVIHKNKDCYRQCTTRMREGCNEQGEMEADTQFSLNYVHPQRERDLQIKTLACSI